MRIRQFFKRRKLVSHAVAAAVFALAFSITANAASIPIGGGGGKLCA